MAGGWVLIALLAVGTPSTAQFGSMDVAVAEGFEEGMPDWSVAADVPDDPNKAGEPVTWHVKPSTDKPLNGKRSLELFLDGRQDDGTVWAVRRLPFNPEPGSEIQLKFRFWSQFKGSINNPAFVVVYAGSEPRNWSRTSPD